MTDSSSIQPYQRDEFLQGFLVCMLWCTRDGEEDGLDANYGLMDLAGPTREGLRAQCNDFIDANAADLIAATNRPGYTFERAGHDFMLSSNGHGAGYFDRGLGEVGERLQAAAQQAPSTEAYAGDDHLVYVAGLENYTSSRPAPPKP